MFLGILAFELEGFGLWAWGSRAEMDCTSCNWLSCTALHGSAGVTGCLRMQFPIVGRR